MEMLQVLKAKFNPMTPERILQLQDSLRQIKLSDSQDLDDFVNEMRDINLQLSEVGQGFTEFQLVNLALHQLGSSRSR